MLIKKIFITILTLFVLSLTACFSPWLGNEGTGFITFNFDSETNGGATYRSSSILDRSASVIPPPGILNRLTHTVTLERMENNSVVERIPPFSINRVTHTESVTPGLWRITVRSLLDGTVFAEGHNEVSVAGGEETSANIPMILEFILISTREELAAIGTNTATLGRKYILANSDISASNWTPIGNENNPFTGVFDGNNQIISDLSNPANPPTGAASPFGLFGVIGGNAIVKNVNLVDVDIYLPGGIGIGSLVGVVEVGIVENNSVTGEVFGDTFVGGLVGVNEGIVRNSFANIETTGSNIVGGLVGFNEGTIQNSYAIGIVSGDAGVGGLVGENFEGGIVQNSYATGNVSGTSDDIGGLVGLNEGTVQNSFATGNVEGYNYVGGLVGQNVAGSIIRNSVALNQRVVAIRTNPPNPLFGRVVGNNQTGGNLTNNYGRDNMEAGSGLTFSGEVTHNGRNGADIETEEAYCDGWWASPPEGWSSTDGASAWNFNTVWNPPVNDASNANNNRLPTLRNMPSGTQTPHVRN